MDPCSPLKKAAAIPKSGPPRSQISAAKSTLRAASSLAVQCVVSLFLAVRFVSLRSIPRRAAIGRDCRNRQSAVDSARGRDAPHTRLEAVAVTPFASTADQLGRRRYRQHSRVRDPKRPLANGSFRTINFSVPAVSPCLWAANTRRKIMPVAYPGAYRSNVQAGSKTPCW
jgi:hypothetical protein